MAMKKTTDMYRVGSIYYNPEKEFYLLITNKTDTKIQGYTSKYGNPTMKEKLQGLNTERIGTFDFGGLHIAFGNPFSMDVNDKEFPRLTYIRTLMKIEVQTFRLIVNSVLHGTLYKISRTGEHIKFR